MMHFFKVTIVSLLMALAAGGIATAGPFEDGFAAYQRGDYTSAMQLLRPLGEQRNKNAAVVLGLMYEGGLGVPQNFTEAANWYRLAAEQGHLNGQFQLGSLYQRGLGVPQNLLEAYRWYRLAALQGLTDAYHVIGTMFLDGSALPKHEIHALAMFYVAGKAADSDRQRLERAMLPLDVIQSKAIAADCAGPKMTECSWLPSLPVEINSSSSSPPSLPIASTRHTVVASDYPAISIRGQEKGAVVVAYVVRIDGEVSNCSVVATSGFQRLDDAACAIVVNRWKYKPATIAGTPVDYKLVGIVSFQLR